MRVTSPSTPSPWRRHRFAPGFTPRAAHSAARCEARSQFALAPHLPAAQRRRSGSRPGGARGLGLEHAQQGGELGGSCRLPLPLAPLAERTARPARPRAAECKPRPAPGARCAERHPVGDVSAPVRAHHDDIARGQHVGGSGGALGQGLPRRSGGHGAAASRAGAKPWPCASSRTSGWTRSRWGTLRTGMLRARWRLPAFRPPLHQEWRRQLDVRTRKRGLKPRPRALKLPVEPGRMSCRAAGSRV
jgi:hypothetical protein